MREFTRIDGEYTALVAKPESVGPQDWARYVAERLSVFGDTERFTFEPGGQCRLTLLMTDGTGVETYRVIAAELGTIVGEHWGPFDSDQPEAEAFIRRIVRRELKRAMVKP